MFKNYIKTAWRSLWKNKFYNLLNIGGLAVGVFAGIAIFILCLGLFGLSTYTFFKIANRNILRNKGFSCINIDGLAIGKASAALICTHSFGIGYHRNYRGKFAGHQRRHWQIPLKVSGGSNNPKL